MSTVTGRTATVSVEVGGQEIVFETGKLAKQADGAVLCRSGETMILATAVGRADTRPDADFFPLTVDVEERMYAAGKIPGGFFKREGRASECATDHDASAFSNFPFQGHSGAGFGPPDGTGGRGQRLAAVSRTHSRWKLE